MNQRDFYRLAISLGAFPDSTDFVVKRDDFVDWMRGQGYAERTIANHAAPSRQGGIINKLMNDGLVVDGGVRRWCIPFVQSLNEKSTAKDKRHSSVKLFSGSPPSGEGWITGARLDDDEQGPEWRLFRKEYAPSCNNLKVSAVGSRVPHKANYWLQSKNGRLVMSKNATLLKQHRPDIFDSLCEELEELEAGL